MAIAVDKNYDKAQRKISTANLAQFAGVDCQLLVEKETHRPVIMNGTTLGGAFKCVSTAEVNAVQETANSTYATKTEVTQGLAGKAPNDHTHTKSQITDFPTIPDTSGLIPKVGYRGSLKGFEGSTKGATVNDTSADTQHTGSNVTVKNGANNADRSWTKVVDMTAGTVTLGSNWVWSGGKAPTLKYPGVLTCHWNGGNNKGIAVYTAGAS